MQEVCILFTVYFILLFFSLLVQKIILISYHLRIILSYFLGIF